MAKTSSITIASLVSHAKQMKFDWSLQTLALVSIVLLALHFILPIFTFLYRYFIRPSKNTVKVYGKWAIVTGATDGIGKALAHRLASRGHSILLISRTQSRLDAVAKEINDRHYKDVDVKTFSIDFSSPLTDSTIKSLQSTISSLDSTVGVLVNNVGQSYDHPQYFHELSQQQIQSLLSTNCSSLTQMTHALLPTFIKQKRGLVVSISSFSSLISTAPLLTEYSACKIYMDQFTRSLASEYRSLYPRIHFQVQNPLFVSTKLAKIRHSSLTVPSASTFAKSSVSHFGYETQTSPFWIHAIQIAFVRAIPESIFNWYALKLHLGLRKRAARKIQANGTNKAE